MTSYRGRRLDGTLREFHQAVDLLDQDTVPQSYYLQVIAGRLQRGPGAAAPGLTSPQLARAQAPPVSAPKPTSRRSSARSSGNERAALTGSSVSTSAPRTLPATIRGGIIIRSNAPTITIRPDLPAAICVCRFCDGEDLVILNPAVPASRVLDLANGLCTAEEHQAVLEYLPTEPPIATAPGGGHTPSASSSTTTQPPTTTTTQPPTTTDLPTSTTAPEEATPPTRSTSSLKEANP